MASNISVDFLWYGMCFSKIMDANSGYRITCEFEHNRKYYIAYLCPYYELSDYEMEKYKISEYSYVVHLFSFEGFKTFEMFPDHDNNWMSNASEFFVSNEIIGIIA